ncbi:hypothetical protein ACQJBY_067492 [Aegilops geniculata]
MAASSPTLLPPLLLRNASRPPPPYALVAVACSNLLRRQALLRATVKIGSTPPPPPADCRRVVQPLDAGKLLFWVGMQWRTSFSERDVCKTKRSRTGERLPRKNPDQDRRAGSGIDHAYITNMQDYRVFAGTWNVGGRSPVQSSDLVIEQKMAWG